jgi:hypothetical protein
MKSSISRKLICCAWGAVWIFAAPSAGSRAAAETVDGFVTEIVSPSDFRVGAFHILTDGKAQCFTETLDSSIEQLAKGHEVFAFQWVFGLREHVHSQSLASAPCAKLPLTVGSHVQVIGNANRTGGSFLAVRITDYAVTIQQHVVLEKSHITWDGGALIEEQPKVSRSGKDWAGTIWVDGYPMALAPDTQLLAAPPGTELSYRTFGSFSEPQWGAVMPQAPSPAFTGALFQPNTWAAYIGMSASELRPRAQADDRGESAFDGQWVGESADSDLAQPAKRDASEFRDNVAPSQIRLWPNQLSAEEKEYVAYLLPLIHPPDWTRHVPGSIEFQDQPAKKNLQILPKESVQEFVSGLGTSLIPEYQRTLAEGDPTKIHFKFYAVQGEHPTANDEMNQGDGVLALSRNDLDRGVVAFPDGLIVIPDYVLARINNQAQLAMVLSSAITSVIQKQGFTRKRDHPVVEAFCTDSPCVVPIVPLFDLLLNEQVLRIGIRQMFLAGYDIRQAPTAWAAAAGNPANPFPELKKRPIEIPWYTAYCFDYISRYYSSVDYNELKRGEVEYAQFLDELRKADPEAFAPKTK